MLHTHTPFTNGVPYKYVTRMLNILMQIPISVPSRLKNYTLLDGDGASIWEFRTLRLLFARFVAMGHIQYHKGPEQYDGILITVVAGS